METPQEPLTAIPADASVISEKTHNIFTNRNVLLATGAAMLIGVTGCGSAEHASDHVQLLAKEAQVNSTATVHATSGTPNTIKVTADATASVGSLPQNTERSKKSHSSSAPSAEVKIGADIKTDDKDIDAFVQKWLKDTGPQKLTFPTNCPDLKTGDLMPNNLLTVPDIKVNVPTPDVTVGGDSVFTKDLNALIEKEMQKETAEANKQVQTELQSQKDTANKLMQDQMAKVQEQLKKSGDTLRLCAVAK